MPNNLPTTRLFNIPGDVLTHHFALYLTPFEILNFLAACPSPSYSNTQSVLSQGKIWAFYFQRYLPFIKISVENNGNLFFKEEGRYQLTVLEDEDEVYLKKGNELYIQKGNGQRLLYDYKTAFRFEIHHVLNDLKKNKRNWQDDILQCKLLRSDKLFMYEAINRNSEAYKLLDPVLKPDRELICAAVQKNDSNNLLRHVPVNRQWELSTSRHMGVLGIFITFLVRKYYGNSNEDNVYDMDIPRLLLILSIGVICYQRIKPYSVFGFFAKRYPGNHIESYEEAPDEYKNEESSDDEDDNILLPLNI